MLWFGLRVLFVLSCLCLWPLCYIHQISRLVRLLVVGIVTKFSNLESWQANQLDSFNVYEVLLEYSTLAIGVISSVRCISILLLFDGLSPQLSGFFYLRWHGISKKTCTYLCSPLTLPLPSLLKSKKDLGKA